MIQDSKEQHGEGQTPRKCMDKFIQDPRDRGDEQYPHPLPKWLGESPPEVQENQLRRGPTEKMVGAPVAAGERRRQRGDGGGWEP
jgi:hypothetical protein